MENIQIRTSICFDMTFVLVLVRMYDSEFRQAGLACQPSQFNLQLLSVQYIYFLSLISEL